MASTLQSAEASSNGQQAAQLAALLHGVTLAPLDNLGWIRVTGSDRVRWLNGMVTNSIQDLPPGQGSYNFVLNAQGRIQGDLTAYAEPNALLLETDRTQLPALLAHFERFIIMDDVELADLSDSRHGLLVAGPDAPAAVERLGGAPCTRTPSPSQDWPTLSLEQTSYHGAPVDLIRAYSPLIPRFEIWADAPTVAKIFAELDLIPRVSREALEILRIVEGTPRYGTDIRNTEAAHDLPQETAQTHALHFAKGCYLGQEIVERIRSRGNVHRTFSGFKLTGSLPAPGALLTVESKTVGELTSFAAIPLPSGPIQLALGYIRREALEHKLILEYPGGTAAPVKLPYQRIS